MDRRHGKHLFGDMVYALCRMGILESRRPICPGKRSRSWLNEQILSNERLRDRANVRALCREFGITPRTGYKWLKRFRERRRDGAV